MKLTARSIVLSIFYFIFYFLFFISPVSASATFDVAQSQNPQVNPYLNPNTNPDVPKNLHTWTQTVMIEVMSAMSCQLTGIDPTDPKAQCLGVDPKSGNIGFVPSAGSGQVGGGGAIGVAGKMIAMLYTPPLHTSDYFKYLASNFGIAKSAHAAGFEGLKPVQNLWIAFRNVVYLLFVIIFIVIGLAIMLRVRIDPRTVMTIQNQIPKIIIGILLLTFSFAIAGFLIDLMYVVIFLSYEVISGAVAPDLLKGLNPLGLQEKSALGAAGSIQGGGVFGIAHESAKSLKTVMQDMFSITSCNNITNCIDALFNPFKIISQAFDPNKSISIADFGIDLISSIAGGIMFFKIAGLQATFTTPIIGDLFNLLIKGGQLIGSFATAAVTFVAVETLLRTVIPYFIPFMIILIALTFALFRLWFTLILAYIGILLDVVFAPFWIAASLLPGSPIGFGAWLRSIIANLAAFPATIIMFLLAKVFIDAFGASKADTDFVPPLIGALPGTDILGNLIALGILLMTPNVVAMIKAALRAPSMQAGGPIGAAIAVGGGVLTGPSGILRQGLALSAGQWVGARFGLTPRQNVGAPASGAGGGRGTP